MSITLMAYPTAFLISPQDARNNKLEILNTDKVSKFDKSFSQDKLDFIRVRTNITSNELIYLMNQIKCKQLSFEEYVLPNGIQVTYKISDEGFNILLKGKNVENFNTKGEEFFKKLDAASNRNIRLINGQELFYYNYSTSYSNIKEVFHFLKKKGAQKVQISGENEVIAEINGNNIRYYKRQGEVNFTLEVEQIISVIDINVGQKYSQILKGSLEELTIETNIKPNELKTLLSKANYLYYEGNAQTPLKNSDAILNWHIKDGHYIANFSGKNTEGIAKEAEILFRKLNMAAGRDLRNLDEKSIVVYTYSTNYTDKLMLINTLTEHGASDLCEQDGNITCKLFNMEMQYFKSDSADAYTLNIKQVSDVALCSELIDDLNDEYGLNIQEMTYNKIKERLESENLNLESETVLEDNSIVLTIEV